MPKSKAPRPELLLFLFAIRICLEKSTRQLAAGKRTTANAACWELLPPCWAAHEPVDMFDAGWKIRNPPQQTQGGLEQRDWDRGREGREGRTIHRWTPL